MLCARVCACFVTSPILMRQAKAQASSRCCFSSCIMAMKHLNSDEYVSFPRLWIVSLPRVRVHALAIACMHLYSPYSKEARRMLDQTWHCQLLMKPFASDLTFSVHRSRRGQSSSSFFLVLLRRRRINENLSSRNIDNFSCANVILAEGFPLYFSRVKLKRWLGVQLGIQRL